MKFGTGDFHENSVSKFQISLISDTLREYIYIVDRYQILCRLDNNVNWIHVRISLATLSNLYIVDRDIWYNNTK